jgi:glutamate/tyrosine decarboxylase-like PLP-dependent enzyme
MMMSINDDTAPTRKEIREVISLLSKEAAKYLENLDDRPTRSNRVQEALESFDEPLPQVGSGAIQALTTLINECIDASVATAGPRSFHFVVGGTTPAALGADWLTSTLDQMAYAWVASPLATRLEQVSLRWLLEMFGLPEDWQGIMTTGATMANFVGLAAARQWYGEQLGVDVAEEGLGSLPNIRVFSSGIIHPSDIKVLSMLGLGRSSVTRCTQGEDGEFDLLALENELKALDGSPAIIIAVAGEPNAGLFDPISELADLADEYNVWLHVDGAFGLFAALSPEHAALVKGVNRARSVTVDGHKWLNVPYDCGFAFVSDAKLMGKTFAHSAEYLPDPSDPQPVLGSLAPEMSRRARSLTVWATLKAYGVQGIRQMVEQNIALAQYLAQLVDDLPDLELLAEVPLNVVCFRYNPGSLAEVRLNEINETLAAALIEDGRVFVGSTTYRGKIGLRPAISNWRSRPVDMETLVEVVRELGAQILREK